MLLKEFYIDKFIQKFEAAKRNLNSETDEVFNAGLAKAIHILEEIKMEELHDKSKRIID